MKDKELNANVIDGQLKKSYQKPVVAKIQLLAEQAVLATCKWGISVGSRNDCFTAGDLSCVSAPRS
jgi:hypothetical protein